MTGASRLRGLAIAVAGLVALMLFASRWASRGGPGHPHRDAEVDRNGVASHAEVTAPPDLSFYRALGPGSQKPPEILDEAAGQAAVVQPSPPPPAAQARAFVVQVLVTRDGSQARRLRDRLASRGLPVAVQEGRIRGRPVYRIRIGPYADHQGAEAALRRLRSERGLSPWILRERE